MYILDYTNIYKHCLISIFMKKIIKKYGNSHVIGLTSEDMKIHGLQEGSVVDISDIVAVQHPMYFDEKKADENITKILNGDKDNGIRS